MHRSISRRMRSTLVSTDATVLFHGTIVTGINSINTVPRCIDFNYRLSVCKNLVRFIRSMLL